jgi:hypothetical protein
LGTRISSKLQERRPSSLASAKLDLEAKCAAPQLCAGGHAAAKPGYEVLRSLRSALLIRMKVGVIREPLQKLVVTGRLKIGEHALHEEVHNRRRVPDIKVERNQFLP